SPRPGSRRGLRYHPPVQDPTAVRTMKDDPSVLLDVAADLVVHVRRDVHVTPLARTRTDFDHRQPAALSKDALVAGAQVGVHLAGNLFPLAAYAPDFFFQGRNPGLNLGGLLVDGNVSGLDLGVGLAQAGFLLLAWI